VHYTHNRSSVFDFSWTMRGNHVLKVVAHASPPMSATPGFRQYDFWVDGQSFFTFPKLYRLGLAANDPRANPTSPSHPASLAERSQRRPTDFDSRLPITNIASLEAPHNPDEEEAYLQEAIRQSLADPSAKAAAPAARGTDLLGFDGPPAPAPVSAFSSLAPAPIPQVPSEPFGASQHSFGAPALPPSDYNPYRAPAAAPWGAPAPPSDPWGAPAAAPVTNGYSYAPPAAAPLPAIMPAPAPAATHSPYGQSYHGMPNSLSNPPTSAGPYGAAAYGDGMPNALSNPSAAAGPYGAAAPAVYGAPAPWNAPVAQTPYGDVPPSSVTPQNQQTPSTLGFMSPAPTFSGYSPMPSNQDTPAPTQQPEHAPMSMHSLSREEDPIDHNGAPASGLDQAYAKLVNLDTFAFVTKTEATASNPFSSGSINDNRSLADMAKKKVSHSFICPACWFSRLCTQPFDLPQSVAPKEVMRSMAPGALVPASQNTSYASQYGVQPMQQQGYQQPSYGQQQHGYQQEPMYGQPPAATQPLFGQPQPQLGQAPPQPQYGQAPPPPQFGQAPPPPQFGQAPPQPQYGQAPPQPQYGQAPPAQYGLQFAPQPQYGQAPPQPQYGQQFAPQQGFNY
jgi:hypothetical protein